MARPSFMTFITISAFFSFVVILHLFYVSYLLVDYILQDFIG